MHKQNTCICLTQNVGKEIQHKKLNGTGPTKGKNAERPGDRRDVGRDRACVLKSMGVLP